MDLDIFSNTRMSSEIPQNLVIWVMAAVFGADLLSVCLP